MTETDYSTFERAFERVCGAFRLKLKATEAEDLTRTYFRVLETYPLDEVLLAGKKCLGKHRRFPPAADWIAELTGTDVASLPSDRRQMGSAELDEHERAQRLRYQDHPCLCSECCRAGVDEKPLRFVPTVFGDDEERAFNPRRKAVQIVGHWAHGEELRQWYEARDAFFAAATKFPHLRRLVVRDREPGEEG